MASILELVLEKKYGSYIGIILLEFWCGGRNSELLQRQAPIIIIQKDVNNVI